MGNRPNNYGVSTQWKYFDVARWSKAQGYQDRYRYYDLLWVNEVPSELRNEYYEYLESAAVPVMLGHEVPEPLDCLKSVIKRHYDPDQQEELKSWLNRQAAFSKIKAYALIKFKEDYSGEEYRVLRKAG